MRIISSASKERFFAEVKTQSKVKLEKTRAQLIGQIVNGQTREDLIGQ
jgi:hypothetical protein